MIKRTLIYPMQGAVAQLLSTRILPVILLLAIGFETSQAEPAPKAELVAPGIWRIHLGKPEKFTPTFFRAAAMDKEDLKALPAADQFPLDAAGIDFTVTGGGCAVRLPMTAEIVRSNRRGGPEGVIDAVEQLAPDGFSDIDQVLSHSQREAIVRGYASKAGFAALPGLAAVRA